MSDRHAKVAARIRPLDELERSWRRSDLIFSMIRDEDAGLWHQRPIPLRHPPIFYLGHLPAFAWNQLGAGVLGKAPIDPKLDRLFERGIDPLSADKAEEARIEAWPARLETELYRDTVRERIREVVSELDEHGDDPLAAGHRIVQLVLEHELMHHETLLYILARAPLDALQRPAEWPDVVQGAAGLPPAVIDLPAAHVRLGVDFEDVPFGWDNEFGHVVREVPAFSIDKLPVTVEQFAAFIEDGGYERETLWTQAAWTWRTTNAVEHPVDWRRVGSSWMIRSLLSEHRLQDVSGWPVHVSHAEAAAYARWQDARLPSEAELTRAAFGAENTRTHPWGNAPWTPERANLEFVTGGREPVGSRPAGATPEGVHELVGNGWEWTCSPFRPLPGFTAWARTYPGYSADFFDDEHHVVFGASWATDRRLIRPSFRNWYQLHYPYTFSTFRLVR